MKTAFLNKVIHTEDSAAEDQNTVNLEEKQDHVCVPEDWAQSQHIPLDLSGLLGKS